MIFEPIHIFCALGLGFTLGMGLITTLFMWFNCKHEYEVIDNYQKHMHYTDIDENIIKHIYISRCKYCGKIKKTII